MTPTHRTRPARALLTLALSGLAACSGASSTSSATDQLLAAYDRVLSCGAAPNPLPDAVRQYFNNQISKSIAQSSALQGSGLTADQISACAGAFAQITCDQLAQSSTLSSLSACNPVGTLLDGSACSSSVQCQSGFCTVGIQACGECQHQQSAGQPCGGANPGCGTGLSCVNSTCVAMASAGAACGAPAAPDCQNGLSCVSGACVAVTFGKAGAACSANGAGPALCGTGLACVNGTCTARLSDGQACTATTPCGAFSFCTAGSVCAPLVAPGLGGQCMNGVIGCMEGYCAPSGNCEALLANGQRCTSGSSCQSTLCVNQFCAAPPTCPPQ